LVVSAQKAAHGFLEAVRSFFVGACPKVGTLFENHGRSFSEPKK
jgi:hypothetical protein